MSTKFRTTRPSISTFYPNATHRRSKIKMENVSYPYQKQYYVNPAHSKLTPEIKNFAEFSNRCIFVKSSPQLKTISIPQEKTRTTLPTEKWHKDQNPHTLMYFTVFRLIITKSNISREQIPEHQIRVYYISNYCAVARNLLPGSHFSPI